jgi:hypothetical protein
MALDTPGWPTTASVDVAGKQTMTSAEQSTTKTPTPATAGDAGELTDDDLIDRFGHEVETGKWGSATGTKDELLNRLRRATPAAESGMVMLPKVLVEQALDWANTLVVAYGYPIDEKAFGDLSAIRAAADPAPDEGENEDDIVTTGHWMDKPEGFSP